MKTAHLYIRVSTDEQADKGYSQRDQHERLKKYCEINQINVGEVIFEDHSAKTFIRPAWTDFLKKLKNKKGALIWYCLQNGIVLAVMPEMLMA